MTDKRCSPELVTDIDRIASTIAGTPQDKKSVLQAISEAVILGAQIAEQCAANLSTQKDAS